MAGGRPKIPNDVKKARGTLQPCRMEKPSEVFPVQHEPGEKKPRRPRYFSEYAAEFWHKHFNRLWEQGWLSRQNLESFITVCKIFADMRELENDIMKNGRTTVVIRAKSPKPIERPEWKMYRDTRNDLMRWSQEMGITPPTERHYLPGDKKAEKDKAKETGKKPANIRDFINAG